LPEDYVNAFMRDREHNVERRRCAQAYFGWTVNETRSETANISAVSGFRWAVKARGHDDGV
jgi:hypothetical protein